MEPPKRPPKSTEGKKLPVREAVAKELSRASLGGRDPNDIIVRISESPSNPFAEEPTPQIAKSGDGHVPKNPFADAASVKDSVIDQSKGRASKALSQNPFADASSEKEISSSNLSVASKSANNNSNTITRPLSGNPFTNDMVTRNSNVGVASKGVVPVPPPRPSPNRINSSRIDDEDRDRLSRASQIPPSSFSVQTPSTYSISSPSFSHMNAPSRPSEAMNQSLSISVSSSSDSHHTEGSTSPKSGGGGSSSPTTQRPRKASSHYHYQANFDYSQTPSSIYHKVRFSVQWLIISLISHILQFTMLLVEARYVMKTPTFIAVTVIVIVVGLLLISTRYFVTKKQRENIVAHRGKRTPDDEADEIPDIAIYLLAIAAILEGCAYSVFTAAVAGSTMLGDQGFHSNDTLMQTLRFASVTMLAFHQIIRPSNRVDPLRTMLELEVVSVCWDALDGSTIFQLLDTPTLSFAVQFSLRTLMAFWFFSVGCRIAVMYLAHLPPTNRLYKMVLTHPLSLAPLPTVDRTLQALRLRSIVVIVMSAAEFFAAALRIYLWTRGQLDVLQKEMTLKNVLFLLSVESAYDMWMNSTTRAWNTREIGCGIYYPDREFQLRWLKWIFCIFYLLEGCLLSLVLVNADYKGGKVWVANIALDVLLVVIFLLYCGNTHVQSVNTYNPYWFLPQKSFVIFPATLAALISIVLACNLFLVRVPAIYFCEDILRKALLKDPTIWWSYGNALLIVTLSVLPIASLALFWSISYMVFRKEFTASPGNYNAIHDPTIYMVAMSSMIEGAMDVISCAQLMALASNDNLSTATNYIIVIFCLLELLNACQSFAFQALLSGGHDDTPMDLVRYKAYLRGLRGSIDLGTFFLRLVLWVKYDAVSSVFLIKNLYNLLHTFNQVERWSGVREYPKGTLFTEYVPPAEWYGLTKEEWRIATKQTVALQARSGRAV